MAGFFRKEYKKILGGKILGAEVRKWSRALQNIILRTIDIQVLPLFKGNNKDVKQTHIHTI